MESNIEWIDNRIGVVTNNINQIVGKIKTANDAQENNRLIELSHILDMAKIRLKMLTDERHTLIMESVFEEKN